MQWMFKSKNNDIPMTGVDWIVLSANAFGIAIVVLASMQANVTHHTIADATPTETVEMASLN